jgi:four helix bundle protein
MAGADDKGLETLQVWKNRLHLQLRFVEISCPRYLFRKKWSLIEQLQRSAQSIPANIAEGYGRYYFQEGIRFCYTARGSLEETFSHLILAYQLDYIIDETHKQLNNQIKKYE